MHLSTILLILIIQSVNAFEDGCKACRIVANEIKTRIDNEGQRNHIDMRWKLDTEGKRVGKLIEYRISELRMYEIFEDICDAVRKTHTWGYRYPEKLSPTLEIGWVHMDVAKDIPAGLPDEEEKSRKIRLVSFCGKLIENYEDNLIEAIKSGFEDENSISELLCHKLSKSCQKEDYDYNYNYDVQQHEEL